MGVGKASFHKQERFSTKPGVGTASRAPEVCPGMILAGLEARGSPSARACR